MPDQREIEIKFPLSDPKKTRQSLLQVGASSEGRHFEDNIRLDNRDRTLSSRRLVLRLRRIVFEDQAQQCFMTVKLPDEPDSHHAFSIRREIETQVSDSDATLAALAVLGYEPYWRYEKRRETFVWRDLKAEIDELPFGWFLELEGSPQEIVHLAAQLGFDMKEGLTLSYAAIFENVKRALGLSVSDLTFDSFGGIPVELRHYSGGSV